MGLGLGLVWVFLITATVLSKSAARNWAREYILWIMVMTVADIENKLIYYAILLVRYNEVDSKWSYAYIDVHLDATT